MSQNQLANFYRAVKYKAIDTSGCIGSLYDNRTNCLIKRSNENSVQSYSTPLKSTHCKMTYGSTNPDFNLLQLIDINDTLRLHLLLNKGKKIGIATVMNYSHCIDAQTRILYYSFTERRDQVVKIEDVSRMLRSADPQRIATHVITAIDFGIDMVIIMRLPLDPNVTSNADDILKKVYQFLQVDCSPSIKAFDEKDIQYLQKNISLFVYSNTPSFTSLNSISQILDHIAQYKNSVSCRSINYYLYETKQLYDQYKNAIGNLPPTYIQDIERCLLQLRTPVQCLEAFIKEHTPKSFVGFVQDRFFKAKQELGRLKDQYMKQAKQLSCITTDFHSGSCDASSIFTALRNDELSILKSQISQLTHYVHDSKEQNSLTTQSQQQQFVYQNQKEQYPFENHSVRTIGITCDENRQHDPSIHLTYTTNNKYNSKRDDSDKMFVYNNRNNLDLSSKTTNDLYPFDQLQNMMPLNNIEDDESQLRPRILMPTDVPDTSFLSMLRSPTSDQMINVLLLGETGVGKSTFINAFVNYLSFNTFEQAELNKPVVLIPVSFLMTVGQNFDERIVKFDDVNESKNEDFDHPGQSVTQHCKSYIFYLEDDKKLCIIDTPGFCDTRGIEQDNRNMQNILEYINNLTHLNAICFLLKPNCSRLNIFFRSCIMQILDLLGPNICKNLTFCFTNARSTFYTPGDTAPLLKNMLKSSGIGNIPFEKENTFCFDSESFRYLVALRNDITFNEEDKQEYELSWSTSVKESKRLIDYIRTKLVLYPKKSDWQSPKHAQFEIMYMIRPMLEAMRNNLRNIILQRKGFSHKRVVLKPRILHRQAFLCLKCKQETLLIEQFLIVKECPHEIQDTCLFRQCSCTPDQHIRIYHLLDYQSMDISTNTDDVIDLLCQAGATFTYFLMNIVHSLREDPFDGGLIRMMIQENDLSEYQNSSNLNSQLVEELRKLQQTYEDNKNSLILKSEHIPLTDIYHWMDRIRQLSIIKTQMDVIEQGREILMKQHENEHQEI